MIFPDQELDPLGPAPQSRPVDRGVGPRTAPA